MTASALSPRPGLRLAVHVAGTLALSLSLAPAVLAGELYMAATIGVSDGVGKSGGTNTFIGNIENKGSDSDWAPVVGGAVGLAFPLTDALGPEIDLPPWLPWKLRVPGWGFRFELEAMAGHNYDLRTKGVVSGVPYHADVSSFTVMANTWLDVSLRKPVNAVFGRVPILETMSVYGGAGVGYARTKLFVSDVVVVGNGSSHNFAWNAGGGVGYPLSDRVFLTAGYRYVDLGKTKVGLTSQSGADRGDYSLKLAAHEGVASVRFNFYEIPFPSSGYPSRDW